MTLILANQVQADLLTIIRVTINAWAELEIFKREAQFQQSRQVKWYYHYGVATVEETVGLITWPWPYFSYLIVVVDAWRQQIIPRITTKTKHLIKYYWSTSEIWTVML